jgi:quercetin dioxygenase-like cupin family protein
VSDSNKPYAPGATYAGDGQYAFELAGDGVVAGGPDYSSAHGNVVVGERMMVAFMRMAPGTGSEPHSHPNEQWIYQLEGKSITYIDGQEIVSKPGTVIYVPANTVHHGHACPEEGSVFFTVKDNSHGLYGIKEEDAALSTS